MPATIGPLFLLQVTVPREWNMPGQLKEHEVAARESSGRGLVLELFSPSLREKLLNGGEHEVFIAQVLREDGEALFAFATAAERALFMELRELDGVGPKTAAGIVAKVSPDTLRLLLSGEVPKGLKVSGLGPKSLEKLAHGLQERRERFSELLSGATALPRTAAQSIPLLGVTPPGLVQAMNKLGLRPADTERLYQALLTEVAGFAELDSGEQLRCLLQRWGQTRIRGNDRGADQ